MQPRALGQRLQEALAIAGLSREEFAQRVGIDITVVSRMARNVYEHVDLPLLERMAQLFGCEVYELLLPVSPDWQPIVGRPRNMFMGQLFHLARTMQAHELRGLVAFLKDVWQYRCYKEALVLMGGEPAPDQEG